MGFWGAVFSSLLGVWQGVPYLYADVVARLADPRGPAQVDSAALRRTRSYRLGQVALAIVPLALLAGSFQAVQLAYAVCGALFMPFLALTLLALNTRRATVGTWRNGWPVNVGLAVTVLYFVFEGLRSLGLLGDA